jgi:hypothetical protein
MSGAINLAVEGTVSFPHLPQLCIWVMVISYGEDPERRYLVVCPEMCPLSSLFLFVRGIPIN